MATKVTESRLPSRVAAPGRQRGSALVLALFSLVLLTGMGTVLLFVTETEMKSTQVDHASKETYFMAEAGLEDGRESLRTRNLTVGINSTMNDELLWYAGSDGVIDVDPDAVEPIFDTSGNLTGIAGVDDDRPIVGPVAFAGGTYAAFLNNDPFDDIDDLTDTNDKVMLTALAVTDDQRWEKVQAIVERMELPIMPATITIMGPAASFNGGNSVPKDYLGDDCSISGLHVPVVGVIGAASEATAEIGVQHPGSYASASDTGVDTVDDIDSTIDPDYKDCDYLLELAYTIREQADVVGNSSTPNSSIGTPGSPNISYIEGDYQMTPNFAGAGLLWVTGELTVQGSWSWYGAIFVVGKGIMRRTGGGTETIDGSIFVASIAGLDQTMWTADDCDGDDGLDGTSDDGIAHSSYTNPGGGNGTTRYCLEAIRQIGALRPLFITDFLQR